MTIESAIFSYLTSKVEITTLVSTRVYATVPPSAPTYPFITFTKITDQPNRDQDGSIGLAEVRLQLDAWAFIVQEQQNISEALRNVLDGFRGLMGTELLDVRRCYLETRNTFQEPDKQGKNLPVHRASLDFIIWHVETLPTL
jgi:hypothetical protein